MDELSMVFTNGLMELVCCSFLCAVQSELGGDHISKFVTTESHTKVQERSHNKSSQNKLNREVAEIKLQLEMMKGLLQKYEED